jgi:hypothetical protein
MNRRGFLALASGLLAPVPEPVRAYSFVGGWHGYRITNLAPPSGSDAIRKEDFDRLTEGWDLEGVLALGDKFLVDGVEAPAVLVIGQSDPRLNGVYSLNKRSWVRPATFTNSRAGTGRKKPQ